MDELTNKLKSEKKICLQFYVNENFVHTLNCTKALLSWGFKTFKSRFETNLAPPSSAFGARVFASLAFGLYYFVTSFSSFFLVLNVDG